eukprot:CFRG3437T1
MQGDYFDDMNHINNNSSSVYTANSRSNFGGGTHDGGDVEMRGMDEDGMDVMSRQSSIEWRSQPTPISAKISLCISRLWKFLTRYKEPAARSIYLGEPEKRRQNHVSNVVCNQKYNIFTFLPMVLYEQFKFFFNMYFLIVAMSQFVPALKIGYLYTYWGPLIFVLAVTIAKEGVDDIARYKRDKEVNNSIYKKLTPTGEVNVSSGDIQVSDMIVIQTNQRVPADMVFLRTSEKSGAAFIRTDQLDGETDWKLRIAVPITQAFPLDATLLRQRACLFADKPMKDIHEFVGTFTTYNDTTGADPQVEPLTIDNTLWTNTVLASGTAVGIVIYTGRESRSVMNTSQPHTKMGLIDEEINFLSKVLFVLTMLLACALVSLKGFDGEWYIYLFRFVLLFSYIIPISLRVNLDMGKTFYAYQIQHDRSIADTVVRTSTIPEELGRICYLLSDKTGTLTQNEMIFKKLHMGSVSFGEDSERDMQEHLFDAFLTVEDEGQKQKPPSHSRTLSGLSVSATSGSVMESLDVSRMESMLSDSMALQRSTKKRLRNLVTAIAVCHNVTPVIQTIGTLEYQAASPDEVALVKWAVRVGLILTHRDLNEMHIETPSGDPLKFDILQSFPFTSETKRMGIIVRDRRTGDITLYIKGADVVMTKIVAFNDWLDEEVGNMAREGLRTLVVARKQLSLEQYEDFSARLKEARTQTVNRDSAIMDVRETLEYDLELLGVTGVEDKLQEDIKPTLELLRNAGIKIWMLTGDKMETATNIAISSRLVSRSQTIHQFKHVETIREARFELQAFKKKRDCALVIDGDALRLCMENFESEFVTLACKAPSVVCCRCSPTQKADITKLVRQYTGVRAAAIGDGGNDVSMIQAADVGIGIVGKEGKQASLAADFSITKFKHVSRLLLWHGRNSYKRSSALAQFVIHRGLIISIIQAVFSAVFYYSAIALYQGLLMVGYATVYTMFPVFSLVLDEDVSSEISMMYPELYNDLTKGRSLTLKTFIGWVLISTYQGGIIMLGALLLFGEGDFINIVAISFTALILTELLMVALTIHKWHWAMFFAELTSLAIYVLSMFVLTDYFDTRFITSPEFVWKTLLITLVSCMPLYVAKYIKHKLAPSSYAKLT